MTTQVIDNPLWTGARPVLSVLVPYFRDDPRPLMRALADQAGAEQARGLAVGAVELVLVDDGGGREELTGAVTAAVKGLPLPARLLVRSRNGGRARARNQLAAASRGGRLLFVDADMTPERGDYLRRWLAVAASDAAAACGGFTVAPGRPGPEHALHHALQSRAECLPAEARARAPAKAVASSNLLVRRDVLEAEPFDDGFHGWGWEDVDWGARVAARWGVQHPDIPARHLGLDTAEALAAKYEQSQANFARLLARQPELVREFPSYRAARALRAAPGRKPLRRGLRALALAGGAPLPLRVAAMKLFRAALYAEVVG